MPRSKSTEFCSSATVVPHKENLLSCVVARRPLYHKVNLPSCVARRPLCHKVNLPRCKARRRHFIITCDIFGIEQANILALCYLFGKTYKTYKPAYSSATQVTEINTLDQTTEKVIDVSRTHSIEGFDDSHETCERCSVSEPVFKHNSLCSSIRHKKCGLGSVLGL